METHPTEATSTQEEWLATLPQIDPNAYLDFSDAGAKGGFGFVQCARVRVAENPWGLAEGTYCALKAFRPVMSYSRVGSVPRWRYVQYEVDVTRRLADAIPQFVPLFYGSFRLADQRVAMLLEWVTPDTPNPNPSGFDDYPKPLDIFQWHTELYLQRRPVTQPLAATLIRNVLLAVDAMHKLGVAHRDIKPENVMITCRTELKVKLVDFGFAKWFAHRPEGVWMRTDQGTLPPCQQEQATDDTVVVNPQAKTAKYHPTDFPLVVRPHDVPKLDFFAIGIITLSFFVNINNVPNCLSVVPRLADKPELQEFLVPLLGPANDIPSVAMHSLRTDWIKTHAFMVREEAPAGETAAEPFEPSFSADLLRLARLANDEAEATEEPKQE